MASNKLSWKGGGITCSAIGCKNARIKCPGKSFFNFPKDEERCKVWIKNVRRKDLEGKSSVVLNKSGYSICADHFEPNQFMNPAQPNRLVWNAVPTLFSVKTEKCRTRQQKSIDREHKNQKGDVSDSESGILAKRAGIRNKKGGDACGAVNCSNARYKRDCFGMSFFRFPKDAARSKAWVQNSGRADLIGKKAADLYRGGYVLCSKHFEPKQFNVPAERNRLTWNAIPTLFEFNVPNRPPSVTIKRQKPRDRSSKSNTARKQGSEDAQGEPIDASSEPVPLNVIRSSCTDQDASEQTVSKDSRPSKSKPVEEKKESSVPMMSMLDNRAVCSSLPCTHTRKRGWRMFRFPTDEPRCRMWVDNCGRQDIEGLDARHLNKCYFLCSDHFEDSQFTAALTKKTLIPDAVPTLFPIPTTLLRKSRKRPTSENSTPASSSQRHPRDARSSSSHESPTPIKQLKLNNQDASAENVIEKAFKSLPRLTIVCSTVTLKYEKKKWASGEPMLLITRPDLFGLGGHPSDPVFLELSEKCVLTKHVQFCAPLRIPVKNNLGELNMERFTEELKFLIHPDRMFCRGFYRVSARDCRQQPAVPVREFQYPVYRIQSPQCPVWFIGPCAWTDSSNPAHHQCLDCFRTEDYILNATKRREDVSGAAATEVKNQEENEDAKMEAEEKAVGKGSTDQAESVSQQKDRLLEEPADIDIKFEPRDLDYPEPDNNSGMKSEHNCESGVTDVGDDEENISVAHASSSTEEEGDLQDQNKVSAKRTSEQQIDPNDSVRSEKSSANILSGDTVSTEHIDIVLTGKSKRFLSGRLKPGDSVVYSNTDSESDVDSSSVQSGDDSTGHVDTNVRDTSSESSTEEESIPSIEAPIPGNSDDRNTTMQITSHSGNKSQRSVGADADLSASVTVQNSGQPTTAEPSLLQKTTPTMSTKETQSDPEAVRTSVFRKWLLNRLGSGSKVSCNLSADSKMDTAGARTVTLPDGMQVDLSGTDTRLSKSLDQVCLTGGQKIQVVQLPPGSSFRISPHIKKVVTLLPNQPPKVMSVNNPTASTSRKIMDIDELD